MAGRRRSRSTPDESADRAPSDPAAAAREACLRLLAVRPRSRSELAGALRRKDIPDEVGTAVLDRLAEVGLIDDAAFAESAVHSGHTYRGLGRRALGAELRRRGVADEVARDAVSAVRPEDEEQRARELVRRKLRTSTVREEAVLVRRLVGMLARKGYAGGLSFRVVRDELGATDLVEPGESLG